MACALFQERVAHRTSTASVQDIIPALPPARCVDSFPRRLRELLRRRGFNTPLVLSKALHHLAGTHGGYAFRDYALRLPDGYRCPTACKRVRSRILGTTRAPGASAVTPRDGAGPLQGYHQRVRLEFVRARAHEIHSPITWHFKIRNAPKLLQAFQEQIESDYRLLFF
jgi:hypothetical protein